MLRNTRLFLLLLVLSTLALIGWGARAHGASRVIWEYKIDTSHGVLRASPQKMNELGAEGWELISVLETEERVGNVVNARREYIYKRAK
jgi:hypothetical protein